MSTLEFQAATDRIERLEKALRNRTRGAIVLLVLAVATSLVIGQTPSRRTLEAEEFILRGPRGEELATLDSAGTGAALALYDNKHRLRAALRSDSHFSLVNLFDEAEKPVLSVATSADGPVMLLVGKDHKSSAGVGVLGNLPNLQLRDAQGRIRSEFGLMESGPAMRMYDSDGESRAMVALANDIPTVSVAARGLKGGVVIGAGDPGKRRRAGGDIIITGVDGKTTTWAAP